MTNKCNFKEIIVEINSCVDDCYSLKSVTTATAFQSNLKLTEYLNTEFINLLLV